ncbi:MAG: alpha/beta hydrolase [Myxococcales bacterium]
MSPVDRLERFERDGSQQWALVRGERAESPVLLLVQGGPGLPMIHEADALERALSLQEHFRVVYWDQRGTGKSRLRPCTPLSLAALRDDVVAMTHALCERLEVPSVHVAGFSLGASLALLACEEDASRVASLTCVGPDVNLLQSERHAMAFALSEAQRLGRTRILRALRALGEPPHAEARRFSERIKHVADLGGIHRGKTYADLLRHNLSGLWRSPHYSLREMVAALRAIGTLQERLLPELQGFDLGSRPLEPGVPVAIFQGRLDAAAPPQLAVQLAERLQAPLVWFDQSAHSPHFEEPSRFREVLLRFALEVSPR